MTFHHIRPALQLPGLSRRRFCSYRRGFHRHVLQEISNGKRWYLIIPAYRTVRESLETANHFHKVFPVLFFLNSPMPLTVPNASHCLRTSLTKILQHLVGHDDMGGKPCASAKRLRKARKASNSSWLSAANGAATGRLPVNKTGAATGRRDLRPRFCGFSSLRMTASSTFLPLYKTCLPLSGSTSGGCLLRKLSRTDRSATSASGSPANRAAARRAPPRKSSAFQKCPFVTSGLKLPRKMSVSVRALTCSSARTMALKAFWANIVPSNRCGGFLHTSQFPQSPSVCSPK